MSGGSYGGYNPNWWQNFQPPPDPNPFTNPQYPGVPDNSSRAANQTYGLGVFNDQALDLSQNQIGQSGANMTAPTPNAQQQAAMGAQNNGMMMGTLGGPGYGPNALGSAGPGGDVWRHNQQFQQPQRYGGGGKGGGGMTGGGGGGKGGQQQHPRGYDQFGNSPQNLAAHQQANDAWRQSGMHGNVNDFMGQNYPNLPQLQNAQYMTGGQGGGYGGGYGGGGGGKGGGMRQQQPPWQQQQQQPPWQQQQPGMMGGVPGAMGGKGGGMGGSRYGGGGGGKGGGGQNQGYGYNPQFNYTSGGGQRYGGGGGKGGGGGGKGGGMGGFGGRFG